MLTKDERKPNNISRVATRALLFNHFLTRGLRTEEELQFYVREFLNFVIPKHPVCPHHVAPWQAFSDIFFERKHSTFLFGSRSSGKTRMLSLLNNVEATFKPGIQICVDKDTPIDCLRNTKVFPEGIPIKDLIGRKFWVYSYSLKNQKVELKRGHSVHSQGFKKCVCIKYSWGKGKYDDFIIVDESHEVLLRDGLTYKKAKDIKEGDSLMPFVREWDQHNYPRVYAPGVGCVYEHQFAVSEIIGRVTSSEEVIHHESFNPWDTRVNQLKIMTRSDHQKLHARAGDHASKVFKEFWASMTEQERKSFSKRRVEARKANYPNNIQLQEYYKKFKTEWWKNLDPDYRKKLSDINTSNLPRMYGDENPAFRRDITRNDVLIALLSCQGVVKEMRERLGAKDDGFVYRRFQQYGWDMKFIRSLFSSKWILERKKTSLDSHVLSEYYTARRGRDSFDTENHTVTKVLDVGLREVYSLTVDDNHNYAAKGLFHKNCNAGAILSQAQKNYEYTLSYYEDDLLASTLKNSIQSHTELTNGSIISVITGGMRGFNGQHPEKLRLDEIELIDWYAIQEAFSMTQGNDKWEAQDTLSSTRKFSFGSVQRLLSEAKERDITVYPWCIWESLEKCTRECFNDPIHGDCPVYSKKNVKTGKDDIICGGKAHNCSGFYPISGFIKKVRLLDKNTWKAQWLCEKTGDSSTVYGEFFNEDVHLLKTEEEFMAKFQELEGEPMSPRHRRVSGIDFGGQFAFVRLVKSPTNRRRFYILEVYFSRTDVTLDTHIAKIKKLMWWGQGKEVIFGDHAARQDIIEFNNKGIPVHLAVKEIFNGINLVKSLLENQADGNPGIYLNGPRCEALINEFNSYSYKIRKDGLPDLDSIFKERDHCLDALRYALFSHMKGGGTVRTGKRRNF